MTTLLVTGYYHEHSVDLSVEMYSTPFDLWELFAGRPRRWWRSCEFKLSSCRPVVAGGWQRSKKAKLSTLVPLTHVSLLCVPAMENRLINHTILVTMLDQASRFWQAMGTVMCCRYRWRLCCVNNCWSIAVHFASEDDVSSGEKCIASANWQMESVSAPARCV
jgi:hypothetical protein